MKKANMLLTTLILAALLLAACGGEQTATSAPGTSEPTTATTEPTGTSDLATATAEGTVDVTGTPGIPVTGEESPNRLTNLMDYDVWNQNGEQIGDVNDMVLDFDNTSIAYVIVGTGGFLGLGEKDVLVPWNMLQLQTDGGTTGDQNVLLFTGNEEYYRNAPDFDINNILPEVGQPAEDWDADIESFWSTGVAPDTNAATQAPEATAAATDAAVATATLSVDDPGQGSGMGAGREIQGVLLASELLGSAIQVYGAAPAQGDTQGQSVGTVSPDATAMPADAATATVDAMGAGPVPMDAMALTIEDAIVNPDPGEIQYLVVSGGFAEGERLLPVPLDQLRWDDTTQGFSLGVNTSGLENAPAFQEGQYPDFSSDGWDDEFGNFWNNLESDFLIATPAQ